MNAKNICNLPDTIRANLVRNLNKYDVDKLCRLNSTCNKNVCKNKNLWRYLSKNRFNTEPMEDENFLKFYFNQTLNLYFIDLGTKLYLSVMKGVISISIDISHIGIITFNNDLYMMGDNNNHGELGFVSDNYDEPRLIMSNIRKVVCTRTATFALDFNDKLYQTGKSNIIKAKIFKPIMNYIIDIQKLQFESNLVAIFTVNNDCIVNKKIVAIDCNEFYLQYTDLQFNEDTNNIIIGKLNAENLHLLIMYVNDTNVSTQIKKINITTTYSYPQSSIQIEILLNNGNLIYSYPDRDDDYESYNCQLQSDVTDYVTTEKNLIWIDGSKKKLYIFDYQRSELTTMKLDFTVMKMISQYYNFIHIISTDGNLYELNLLHKYLTFVDKNVFDFEVQKSKQIIIKYD